MINRICVCTSASFYKKSLEIEKELKKLGFKVSAPLTSKLMEKSGNFDISYYKTWFKNPKNYKRKTYLMRNHINKIVNSDAILVLNYKKNGIDGYIGGNTLMEIAIAFYLKLPIFIINNVSEKSPNYEEVLGINPTFIKGDLTKIK